MSISIKVKKEIEETLELDAPEYYIRKYSVLAPDYLMLCANGEIIIVREYGVTSLELEKHPTVYATFMESDYTVRCDRADFIRAYYATLNRLADLMEVPEQEPVSTNQPAY